jgi:hypothetical protein
MSLRPDNDRRRRDGTLKVIRKGLPPESDSQEIRSLDPALDLSLFAPESGGATVVHRLGATRPFGPWTWPSLPVLALSAALVMLAVWWAGPEMFGLGMGRVRIESVPAGAAVVVDGIARGVTPLLVTLTVGAHVVEVGSDATGRDTFEMRVESGPQTYRLQLPAAITTDSLPSASADGRTP